MTVRVEKQLKLECVRKYWNFLPFNVTIISWGIFVERRKNIKFIEYLILSFVQHNKKNILPSKCNDAYLHFQRGKKELLNNKDRQTISTSGNVRFALKSLFGMPLLLW